jgi:hypothetical protein
MEFSAGTTGCTGGLHPLRINRAHCSETPRQSWTYILVPVANHKGAGRFSTLGRRLRQSPGLLRHAGTRPFVETACVSYGITFCSFG